MPVPVGESWGVSFGRSPHPDGFPGSLQESEDAVKALAKEKDLLEREKWELRRQAKEATDHASALRSQLDLKDNRMKELEAELAMVSAAPAPTSPARALAWPRARAAEAFEQPRVSPVRCCGLSAQQLEGLETPGSFDEVPCSLQYCTGVFAAVLPRCVWAAMLHRSFCCSITGGVLYTTVSIGDKCWPQRRDTCTWH